MSLLFNKITASYKDNLPFVCFNKPNSDTLKGYFEKTDALNFSGSFIEKGFVFAPFNNEYPAVVFLNETSEILEETFIKNSQINSNKEHQIIFSDKQNHLNLVQKGINAIKNGAFKKVVLSRKEILKFSSLDIIQTFKRLLQKYDNAFVYVWFHPKVGLWMGATPERLVTLSNGTFHTMALASTQKFEGNMNPIWEEKEKNEHQYVVDYIVSQIKDQQNGIILKKFTVSDTYTVKAGNLLHLKADIKGEIGEFNLNNLLDTLHPTPAVCGLPKEAAKSFILSNENYNRTYYTGFLGEININSNTELFVNLRCVEIIDGKAVIYVGGGITKDSNAAKEWLETCNKSQTIKSVI
ncbi:MAG: chorismate-binding protein [Flavobacteriaceae bacterium]